MFTSDDFLDCHAFTSQIRTFVVTWHRSIGNFKKIFDLQFRKKINTSLLELDGIGKTQVNSINNFFLNKTNLKITKDLIQEEGQKNIGFLLCSDDDTSHSDFMNLPVHFMQKKSAMLDLHALSLCDYNIGPPSSFGTWLSWHGKVPRLCLEQGMDIYSLDQFSISSVC